MSTPPPLGIFHKLLQCFSKKFKIQPERLRDLSSQESYESFLSFICEYIFLFERLQNTGNIYTEFIHNKIRVSTISIKLIFLKIFLFKYYFPISKLNESLTSTSTGLLLVFGWILERSNIFMYLSKYLLQYRTGDLFQQYDEDLSLDLITFYPPVQFVSTLPVKSLHINQTLPYLKSEFSRIRGVLRELSSIVELNIRNELLLLHTDSRNVLISEDLTVKRFRKELRLVDLHYLQSKHLIEAFCINSNNQIFAINMLRTVFSKINHFWRQLDSAYTTEMRDETKEYKHQVMPAPPSLLANISCFINTVISPPITAMILSSNDDIHLDKEQLGCMKHECGLKILRIKQYLSSNCIQYHSIAEKPLVIFKFD
ncbi:hypothetical protein LOD99_14186 [Oopsacas minuta]|uniref:Uncharacterized protein n=1 Tax=Oopsacas minuta TaxID=111878 RepID=A0AAV7KGY5_9METZ|nr:hypothetical protein LOD99_14186 [Oopsacas minuta]